MARRRGGRPSSSRLPGPFLLPTSNRSSLWFFQFSLAPAQAHPETVRTLKPPFRHAARVLPAWRRAVRTLEKDREHGASVLAEDAVRALEAAWRDAPGASAAAAADAVAPFARALRAARPSMPVVTNLVNYAMDRALAGAWPATAAEQRERGARAAAAVLDEAVRARGAAAKRAAEVVRGRVLTLSASETVLKALRAASRAGRVTRAIVGEGRPGFEGRALAKSLAAEGLDTTLVVDAALGLHVAEADVVLVGADAVLPDGSVVNKVGTFLAALAARERGVPFHAVADSFKVSASPAIPLEEKPPREVLSRALPNLGARNIYFDRTPGALVAALHTESATLSPGEVAPLASRAAAWAGWTARVGAHRQR